MPPPPARVNSTSSGGSGLFGLPVRQDHREVINAGLDGNVDFEELYAEDALDEELGSDARVFKTYNDLMAKRDVELVTEGKDGTDVLLVFAGLFSAVLTTFVVQTSQTLQNDTSAVTISLLSEIVRLQRASANGTSLDAVEPAFTSTSPSHFDLWVNGLWFTSLALSLSTALFAVLVKQWLHQYTILYPKNPRERSLMRQFRFAGLQKWHVLTVIRVLPIAMHVSLALFLGGLVVFLVPLEPSIASVVGAITAVVYGLYLITNSLPIFNIQCPYRTPTSDVFFNMVYRPLMSAFTALTQASPPPDLIPTSLRDLEQRVLNQPSTVRTTTKGLFKELMSPSFHPSVHSIAVQAIGNLPVAGQEEDLGISHVALRRHLSDTLGNGLRDGSIGPPNPKFERLFRALAYANCSDLIPAVPHPSAWSEDNDVRLLMLATISHSLTRPEVWPLLLTRSLHHPTKMYLPPHVWKAFFERCHLRLRKEDHDVLAVIIKSFIPSILEQWHQPTVWLEGCQPVSVSFAIRHLAPHTFAAMFKTEIEVTSTSLNNATQNFLFLNRFLLDDKHTAITRTDPRLQASLAEVWTVISERPEMIDIYTGEQSALCAFAEELIRTDTSLSLGQDLWYPEWDTKAVYICLRAIVEADAQLWIHARSAPHWDLAFLARVFELTLGSYQTNPDDDTFLDTMYNIWLVALDHDMDAAYDFVVQKDWLVRGEQWHTPLKSTSDSHFMLELVIKLHDASPKTQAPQRCVAYMFLSSGVLFAVCKRLVRCRSQGWNVENHISCLAELQPHSQSWAGCQDRLKEFYDSMTKENNIYSWIVKDIMTKLEQLLPEYRERAAGTRTGIFHRERPPVYTNRTLPRVAAVDHMEEPLARRPTMGNQEKQPPPRLGFLARICTPKASQEFSNTLPV